MVRPNPERERKILEQWQSGDTIDEISILTDIPRSSIGYYVRKFNRNPVIRETRLGGNTRHGTEIPLNDSENSRRTDDSASATAQLKIFSYSVLIQKAQDLMSADKFDQFYYMLLCQQLFPKVLKTFALTPEEKATLGTLSVSPNPSQRKEASQTPTNDFSNTPKPTYPSMKRRSAPIDLKANEFELL
jgi:hypothetical protein